MYVFGTIPTIRPPATTAPQLKRSWPISIGTPTTATVASPPVASTTARSACSDCASSARCWNRSWHEYAESPSSGKSTIAVRRSAASRRSSIVARALNSGSATRTSGVATATRTRSWPWKSKKSRPGIMAFIGGRRGAREPSSRDLERLAEVFHQVVRVLEADAQADQVVLDADLEPLLGRELEEAHERGLLDERLDPQVALHLEAHDAAEAAHLAARDLVAGMGRQPGVVHALDARVRRQHLGDPLRGLVVPGHSQLEGLQTADEQVRRMRVEDRAQDALVLADPVDHVGAPEDHAAQHVVVAGEELRRRVEDEVDAVGDRPLVDRGRERRVDDREQAMSPPDVGDPVEVDDLVVRVR